MLRRRVGLGALVSAALLPACGSEAPRESRTGLERLIGAPTELSPSIPLTIPDGSVARFGSDVALSGEWLAVGAPVRLAATSFPTPAILGPGSVRIFRRDSSTWTEQAVLTADSAPTPDTFGASVDLRGDLLAVAAPGVRIEAPRQPPLRRDPGSVHIFRLDASSESWNLAAVLTSPDPADEVGFGRPVALGQSRVFVGSPVLESAQAPRDRVYVFREDAGGWVVEQVLTGESVYASPGGPFPPKPFFGQPIVVGDDDELFVGAASIPFGIPLAGRVGVFSTVGNPMSTDAAQVLTDDVPNGGFGAAVNVDMDQLAVGAPAQGAPGAVAGTPDTLGGSVYLLSRSSNQWGDSALIGPPGLEIASFGYNVGLSNGRVFVGGLGLVGMEFLPRVWMFDQLDPAADSALPNPAEAAGGALPPSMDVDEDTLVAGFARVPSAQGEGVAYIYEFEPRPDMPVVDAGGGGVSGAGGTGMGNAGGPASGGEGDQPGVTEVDPESTGGCAIRRTSSSSSDFLLLVLAVLTVASRRSRADKIRAG